MQNKKVLSLFVLTFFVLVISVSTISSAENSYIIKAKTIYTATSNIIQDGMILITNGKISAVGKKLTVPVGTKQIFAETVIPGLIDMHTHLGVYSLPRVEENSDGNEMTNPITPQVRALDSFNFDDPALKAGQAGGVTTIVSRPGLCFTRQFRSLLRNYWLLPIKFYVSSQNK